MSFEYTNLMRAGLDEAAASFQFTPGISLMSALSELKSIRNKTLFPARFQLMQFIEQQQHIHEDARTFGVIGPTSGSEYTFQKLSMVEDISRLPAKQLGMCIDWLVERAMSLDVDHVRDKGYYTRVFRALIEKNCWMRYRESDQRYLNRLLNRHYAYEMGHYLGFTLEQIQGFISRVLPDEIFINKDAEDLIEAYSFNHGGSSLEAKRMLDHYNESDNDETDYDLIDIGNTHQLYEEAAGFDGTEEQFLSWLIERRPLLEGRSRMAFSMYRNLLICAYLMMRALYDSALSDRGDLISDLWERCIEEGDDMLEYYNQNSARYRLPEFDRLDWKKVASEFNEFSEWAPSENRERIYPRDFLVYLGVDRNGNFITENTFSHIPQIMSSGKAVQKRDVLCLIWQIYTFAWEDVAPEDVAGQLQDFIDLSTGILEQCNFTFYLPSLLEYSICRSLIIGGDMEDTYRSIVTQGAESPLCEDMGIRDAKTGTVYGIRFYACEEYTFSDIARTLYDVSEREKINVYNDTRKDIELWMTKADQQLQCGWDCIDDSNALDSIVKLDRVIDLPDSRKE